MNVNVETRPLKLEAPRCKSDPYVGKCYSLLRKAVQFREWSY
jgi:hypothetical protein